MAFVNSPVAICNLALGHLKEPPIASLTDDDPASVVCNKWYDNTRLEALEQHPWNFATKRMEIPKSAVAPAFEYANAFPLPNDFVRLNFIGETIRTIITDYVIENNEILSQEASPLKINYVFDFTNITKMSPLFVKFLAALLAREMAYEITGSNQNVQLLDALVDSKLARAVAIDGQQRPPRRRQRSKFLDARRRGANVASKFVEFD